MKKKISLLIASLALLFSASNTTAATSTAPSAKDWIIHLEVINHWGRPIHLKEGVFVTRESDVYPGMGIDWAMLSGTINNLTISSDVSGYWQQIPGCPSGGYTKNVKVYIIPAPWNPNMPMCQMV